MTRVTAYARRVLPTTPTGAFWLVFVGSLSGCCLLFLLAPLVGRGGSFPVFGQDGYFELARSLVQGDGFVFEPGGSPVYHRPPLYPLVLAPIALLPDALVLPAIVSLHSLMLGGVGALIFRIAHSFFALGVAQGALLVFLANPWLYANVKNPLTPVLQCLLYTTFVYVVGKEIVPRLRGHAASNGQSQVPSWLVIGSLGGVLSLTHGTLIAVTAAFLSILLVLALRWRDGRLLRTAVLAGLVSILLVAPWTYRTGSRLIGSSPSWVVAGSCICISRDIGPAVTHREQRAILLRNFGRLCAFTA